MRIVQTAQDEMQRRHSRVSPVSRVASYLPVSGGVEGEDEKVRHRPVSVIVTVTDWILCDRQVDRLSEKALDYENLLKDLGSLVEYRAAERIRSLLDKVCLFIPYDEVLHCD